MEEHNHKEILLIEDECDFMEQSLNMLMSTGNSMIRMSQDREFDMRQIALEKEPHGLEDDQCFALLYSWPSPTAEDNQDILEINPDLKIIPLFLISGPKKEMDGLTRGLSGTINCFKLSVDLEDFFKRAKKTPMFWGLIDVPSNRVN